MAQITLNSTGVASSGALALQSNGTTTAVTIDTSQNVGIGVSPTTALAISKTKSGSSAESFNLLRMNLQGTGAIGDTVGIRFGTAGSSTDIAGITCITGADATAYGTLTFSVRRFTTDTFDEVGRFDNRGSLLVGTTALRSAERMIVEKNNDAICAKATGSVSNIPYLAWNDATSGNNSLMNFGTEASYTSRGNIDYNRAGGLVRYNTSSDATLKNIIGDSDGIKSIEILNSTRIRDYSWKDDATNKTQIGVIAQELYETYKGAVSVGGEIEKTDEAGNVTTEYRPWAVDKTAFTFHLVKGWQEHHRIIQEQQALITTLTDRITALEAK